MTKSDIEYKILKMIEDDPSLTQRQIAKLVGVSLGKTNYIVRTLIDKGWLKINNFRRSDNKLVYLYHLTPQGLINKSVLAESFLRRKSEEYNRLKEEIEILKKEI